MRTIRHDAAFSRLSLSCDLVHTESFSQPGVNRLGILHIPSLRCRAHAAGSPFSPAHQCTLRASLSVHPPSTRKARQLYSIMWYGPKKETTVDAEGRSSEESTANKINAP